MLVLHRRNVHANHILAVWVALLSVDLLGQIFYAEQAYRDFPHLIGLTNFLPLCYGGFLFLYVRSLIQSSQCRARDLVHFVGFLLGVLLNLEYFLLSGSDKIQLVDQLFAGIEPWNIQLVGWVIPLYASVYAIYASLLLKRQQQLFHQISQVLNDHRGHSFNDYLNQYRVQAVCEGLQQPQQYSLMDLALSCFSSKSSFNAIFKKITGLTPSEYRKNVHR